MRIQYTIPGIDYTGPAQLPDFAPRFAGLEQPPEVDWRNVLELNRPQPGETLLPPPPRPASFTYSDAAETRRQWTNLMIRHTSGPCGSPQEARMLETLARFRQEEEDLQVRILAEPKE